MNFLDHGPLKEVFEDVFPISRNLNTMELEFMAIVSSLNIQHGRGWHDLTKTGEVFFSFPNHDWNGNALYYINDGEADYRIPMILQGFFNDKSWQKWKKLLRFNGYSNRELG